MKSSILSTAFNFIVLIFSAVKAQSSPAGVYIEPVELEMYPKSQTQFDGITFEEYVTYLTFSDDQSAVLRLLTTGQINSPLNFTVMFWIKFDDATISNAPNNLQFIFGLPNDVTCFLTKTVSIMCDTSSRSRLEVISDQIVAGKWIHLVLSTMTNGQAYLMIHDYTKILAVDTAASVFYLTQTLSSGWTVCIGSCFGEKGFNGGFREFMARNYPVPIQVAFESSHEIFAYGTDFKAYFRFANVQDMFNKDQFVDRTWVNFTNGEGLSASDASESNFTVQQLIGQDIIPNDICPLTYSADEFILFGPNSTLSTFNFGANLQETNYGYTMSLTININDTTCTTIDPTVIVSQGCYIVYFDSVFALYFEQDNMARFKFFANKNYYETTSKNFFVPYDQWVTIQISMTQFQGYSFVMLDLNGKIIVQQSKVLNLQKQRPFSNLNLFNSLIGAVADFRLCTQSYSIPIDKNLLNCSVQIKANLLNLDHNNSLQNNGSSGGLLSFSKGPVTGNLAYQQTAYLANTTMGVMSSTTEFDGITCNNQQMTIQLDYSTSSFQFQTPPSVAIMQSFTIEFWIKPIFQDESWFQGMKSIFQMLDPNTQQNYFQIYIKNGDLICAPFGTLSITSPYVLIQNFQAVNTDRWGWWHISCSYSVGNSLALTLNNENVDNFAQTSLLSFGQFLPTNSLNATFGSPFIDVSGQGINTFALKEVRFWSQQFTQDQISNWRRRQIDPTVLAPGLLLNYYRLGAGILQPFNFAQIQNGYNFTDSNQLTGASLYSDSITQTQYVLNQDSSAYVPQQITVYHTVCPLYTYLHDFYCYSEPINRFIITVTPTFDDSTKQLSWLFSTLSSSAIDQNLIPQLQLDWTADDGVLLNQFFTKQEFGSKMIPSESLRQESTYNVNVNIYNKKQTFQNTASIAFVPSQCHWFEVDGSDALNGMTVLAQQVGYADINFSLVLKKHPKNDCGNFNFYDQFLRLDLDFVLTNSVQYINPMKFPSVTQNISGLGTGNIVIALTIPKQEQNKLPVHQDIVIIITVRWTSSIYAAQVQSDTLVFQNVLYTIKFDPEKSNLATLLTQNQQVLYIGDNLLLDASGSYVTNVPQNLSQKDLSFNWVCPLDLKQLCPNTTAMTLAIDYLSFVVLPVPQIRGTLFATNYIFQVTITWNDGTTNPPSQTLSAAVMWINQLFSAQTSLTSPAQANQTITPPPVSTFNNNGSATKNTQGSSSSNTTPPVSSSINSPQGVYFASPQNSQSKNQNTQPASVTSQTTQPTQVSSQNTQPAQVLSQTTQPAQISSPQSSQGAIKTTQTTSGSQTTGQTSSTTSVTANSNSIQPNTVTVINKTGSQSNQQNQQNSSSSQQAPQVSNPSVSATQPVQTNPSTSPTQTSQQSQTSSLTNKTSSVPSTTSSSANQVQAASQSNLTVPSQYIPFNQTVPSQSIPVNPTVSTQSLPNNPTVQSQSLQYPTSSSQYPTVSSGPSTPINQTPFNQTALTTPFLPTNPIPIPVYVAPVTGFGISYFPNPILATSFQTTIFSLANLTIPDEALPNYYIAWSITPDILNPKGRVVQNYGQSLSILPGSWAQNTNYVVQVALSPKNSQKITVKQKVSFTTEAPPQNGTVLATPQTAKVGQQVLLQISDWKTKKPPIQWFVYTSVDAAGQLFGDQLNTEPLSQSDAWTATVQSTPFIIVISDESLEDASVVVNLAQNAGSASLISKQNTLKRIRPK